MGKNGKLNYNQLWLDHTAFSKFYEAADDEIKKCLREDPRLKGPNLHRMLHGTEDSKRWNSKYSAITQTNINVAVKILKIQSGDVLLNGTGKGTPPDRQTKTPKCAATPVSGEASAPMATTGVSSLSLGSDWKSGAKAETGFRDAVAPASTAAAVTAVVEARGSSPEFRVEATGSKGIEAGPMGASSNDAPRAGFTEEDRRRRRREQWITERTASIKAEVIGLLKSNIGLVEAFERVAPDEFQMTKAMPSSPEKRAADINSGLQRLDFVRVLNWMFDAYQELPAQHQGRKALAEISRLFIPWLYVLSDPAPLSLLEPVYIGKIVTLPIGLNCFAELISAGLELRAAEIERGDSADPRGSRAVSDLPARDPTSDLESDLRDALFKKVGVLAAFKNADAATKDRKINERLSFLQTHENKRYYATFFGETQLEADIWKKISDRYTNLAVIQLSPDWMDTHDSWWLMISRLFGYV